jgi:hypothetical protein
MASSSQVRSLADRKTHMLSVLSFSSSRVGAGPWPPGATSYRTELRVSGVADSPLGRRPGVELDQGMRRWRTERSNSTGRVRVADGQRHAR